MNVLNAPELCTLKWLQWEILCYVYFTAIKKREKVGWGCGQVGVSRSRGICKRKGFSDGLGDHSSSKTPHGSVVEIQGQVTTCN